jgi:hypothetical protein
MFSMGCPLGHGLGNQPFNLWIRLKLFKSIASYPQIKGLEVGCSHFNNP